MPHYQFERHRRALGMLGGVLSALAIAGVVVGGVATQHALRRAVERHDGRLAAKSVAGMVVPADYVRITSGCSFYRCYLVRRTIASVARDARGVLASTGAVRKPDPSIPNDGCDHATLPPGWSSRPEQCIDGGDVHHRHVLVIVRTRRAPTADGSFRLARRTEVDIDFRQTPTS